MKNAKHVSVNLKMSHEQVLHFIDTSFDFKDYYYLSETIGGGDDGEVVHLSHFVPDDNGMYQRLGEVVSVNRDINFNYINFLDTNTTSTARGKIPVFYSTSRDFTLKFNKYAFIRITGDSALPRCEVNKYVGVLTYAGNKGEEHILLSIFHKLSESTINYRLMGVFDLNTDTPLAYDIIENITTQGHTLIIYYYGEKIPDAVPLNIQQLMAPMPLSVSVLNRERCPTHDTFSRVCVNCVTKNILIAPRQASVRVIRTVLNETRHSRRNRRRNYVRYSRRQY